MKLFLIIALAKYLHDDPKSEGRTLKDLAVPALIVLVPMALVMKQPDLGTALILGLIFVSICALTRIALRSIVTLVVAGAVLVPVMWNYVLKDYQKTRCDCVPQPGSQHLGTGWHAHHARVAIGNGGLFGQGFMRGTQNQFLFLPDQHSDFPFAVFAETGGSSAAASSSSSTASSVGWSIRIAATSKDRFGAVLAVGVGSLIFWHAFFNLGMVTGILPVVGVTLPLFSAGGSSVMTIMIGIGLLMNVSMRRYYARRARRALRLKRRRTTMRARTSPSPRGCGVVGARSGSRRLREGGVARCQVRLRISTSGVARCQVRLRISASGVARSQVRLRISASGVARYRVRLRISACATRKKGVCQPVTGSRRPKSRTGADGAGTQPRSLAAQTVWFYSAGFGSAPRRRP